MFLVTYGSKRISCKSADHARELAWSLSLTGRIVTAFIDGLILAVFRDGILE